MASPVAIGDVIAVSNLAWKTIQGARKVCGEYDGLTQEVKTIYTLLQRLKRELDNSESLLNQADGESKEELGLLVDQCERALHILDVILDKYNALGDKERSGRRLWQKMRFGTGKVEDVQEQRAKLGNYTSSLSLLLNIATIGSQGRVERQMKEAGGDIKDIQRGVNKITAQLMATRGQEGSVMTSYEDDETAFWKELRRKLVKEGFTSSKIGVHKDIIQAYVKELADRGVLDEIIEIDPSALLSEPDSLRAVKRDVSPSPRTHCKTSGKSDKTPYAESEGSGHITNEERFEADDKAPRFNVANLKKQAAPLLLRDQQDPKDLSQPVFGLAVAERDLSESIKYSNSRYIEFSLEDCYNGVTKMMRVKRRRRNSSDLSIHLDEVIVAIKVKPSYMSDKRIKFAGLGDDTEDGQRHDLHVVLTQKPHPVFERKGDNLNAELTLTTDEIKGKWARTLQHFDGEPHIVLTEKNVKFFSKSGRMRAPMTKVIPGRGMTRSRFPGERGDLIITLKLKACSAKSDLSKSGPDSAKI